MPSEKFRRELRQEISLWQQEGLIDATQRQQLVDRYHLDQLDLAAKNRFTMILVGLGCILIGLGVITFVAANWQEIPRLARVSLLLILFVGVSTSGFALWRQQLGDRLAAAARGQGLLLLGSLILGANMALMAQMFHIGGEPYPLYLLWGLGVLLMAYSLRLTSLGLLAILLIGIGYWQGWWQIQSFFGLPFPTTRLRLDSWLDLGIVHMPIVATILFVPLAYRCRSRVLFTLGAIASMSALVNGLTSPDARGLPGLVIAVTLFLPAALLWSFDDRLWLGVVRLRQRSTAEETTLQPIARHLSMVSLGLTFFFLSFGPITQNLLLRDTPAELFTWSTLPSLIGLLVICIVQWVYLRRSPRRRNRTSLAVAGMVLLGVIILSLTVGNSEWNWLTNVVFNTLVAVLAIGVIRESLAQGNRLAFWFGVVLLSVQILTRMLEMQSELIFKAFILVLCGVAVIAAGLWFETYVRSISTEEDR